MKLNGVIFDLDGTLVDSAPDIRHALNRYLRGLGRRELTLDEATSMIGDGSFVLLQRALAATGDVPDDLLSHLQKFIAIYRDIEADPSQIYPGVVAALEALRARGVPLGLCTNKPESVTRILLDDLDLARFFVAVAGGDTYAVHKPHPAHLAGVITAMGLRPEGCVMVGDGPNDIAAARGLGVPCVLVDYGYGGAEHMRAEAVITRIADLPVALAELGFV